MRGTEPDSRTLRQVKPAEIRHRGVRHQLGEILGVATRMVKQGRAARAFVERPRKDSTCVTHEPQQLAEPWFELAIGRQGKGEHGETLAGFAGSVGPTLNVRNVANTAFHDAAQHEHATEGAPRVRVEPHPPAERKLARRIGREAEKVRRPVPPEPAFEGVPLNRVER